MMADKSIDTQLEFLLKMEKEYPAGLMIYGPTIADYYYRSGDYAKSIEYADKMIAKNRNYSSAYEQKVIALLAKGDADGAEKSATSSIPPRMRRESQAEITHRTACVPTSIGTPANTTRR